MIRLRFGKLAVVGSVLLVTVVLSPGQWVSAQEMFGWDYCVEQIQMGQLPFLYSTEEDFSSSMSATGYVSDGDLLLSSGSVYATNAQLLWGEFPDLGLDAVDILWTNNLDEMVFVEESVIAFSTELPGLAMQGPISPGDLLIITGSGTGAVIPNHALLQADWGIENDVGLDAVQFVGPIDGVDWQDFVTRIAGMSSTLDNASLQELLSEYGIDILFSIEGTVPVSMVDGGMILDGDILSVRSMEVIQQRVLLPSYNLAGISGVDFGLDALATPRDFEPPGDFSAWLPGEVLFSTEILDPSGGFNDGDILKDGISIVAFSSLAIPFEPASVFLGLDALALPCR